MSVNKQPKRRAVRWRAAEFRNETPVERGAVSLVKVKPIVRVFTMQPQHRAVARHFRDDRRCGNRRNQLITLDHCRVWDVKRKPKPSVKKNSDAGHRNRPIVLEDLRNHTARAAVRCLPYIHAINDFWGNVRHRPLDARIVGENPVPRLARLWGQLFGVADSTKDTRRNFHGKENPRNSHWSRERPSARLVYAKHILY